MVDGTCVGRAPDYPPISPAASFIASRNAIMIILYRWDTILPLDPSEVFAWGFGDCIGSCIVFERCLNMIWICLNCFKTFPDSWLHRLMPLLFGRKAVPGMLTFVQVGGPSPTSRGFMIYEMIWAFTYLISWRFLWTRLASLFPTWQLQDFQPLHQRYSTRLIKRWRPEPFSLHWITMGRYGPSVCNTWTIITLLYFCHLWPLCEALISRLKDELSEAEVATVRVATMLKFNEIWWNLCIFIIII